MKPMLAATARSMDDIVFPCYCTPKLDGIRCLTLNGIAVSRTLKPIRNRFIQRTLGGLPNGLDGELILRGNRPFSEVSSAVMSGDGQPDFEYVVFDSFMLQGDYLERIQQLRHEWIDRVRILIPSPILEEKAFLAYEDWCLTEGYEGVMVRNDGRYKFGRSGLKEGLLLKWKRFEDGEATIRFFVEQMENTNPQEDDNLGGHKRGHSKAGKVPKGTLGALEVTDIKTGVEFKIGTGFDNDLRQHVWDNQDMYRDKIVKYKSQPFGEKDKPRFPTFLGWRDREDM